MATVAGSLRNKVLVLDNVTTGDLTVTGNITISGSATTLNSTNTSINDHLIELNAGLTGTNPNDIGLILERGSSGNNVFIGWDESADKVIVASTTADGTSTGNLSLAAANFQAAGILGTSLDINGNADISGTLTMSNSSAGNMLDMNNNNIIGVNRIQIADPGPNEGVSWSNIKIYESPDDLTTNSAGNFQVVYGSTRRLTVNNTGADVNGTLTTSGAIVASGDGHTFYSLGTTSEASFGRNGNERLDIRASDANIELRANQDADSNGAHQFKLNRVFAGTGANDFVIQMKS